MNKIKQTKNLVYTRLIVTKHRVKSLSFYETSIEEVIQAVIILTEGTLKVSRLYRGDRCKRENLSISLRTEASEREGQKRCISVPVFVEIESKFTPMELLEYLIKIFDEQS